MPLQRTWDKNNIVGLWHITDEDESLAKTIPIPPNIHHPLKQKEWRVVRLLYQALCKKYQLAVSDIVYDEAGKPHLLNGQKISVTHSYPYVAVQLHEHAGLDLEKIRDKIRLIAPKFLTDEERQFTQDDVTLLTAAWCVKESIYKWQGEKGISFSQHIAVKPFAPSDTMIEATLTTPKGHTRFSLCVVYEREFVLTYIQCLLSAL